MENVTGKELVEALANLADELRSRPFQNVNGICYVPQRCYDQHVAKFGKAETDKYYAPNPVIPLTNANGKTHTYFYGGPAGGGMKD